MSRGVNDKLKGRFLQASVEKYLADASISNAAASHTKTRTNVLTQLRDQ